MSEHGSSSSFGSGLDSNCGSQSLNPGADNEDGIEENAANTLEGGLFGVLYTVSKEKAPSWPFVAFRLFMDWIQVFLLIVNPAYGWKIDANNKLWQAFSFIQLNYFMSTRGYTFFLICLYIMAVALAINLALCIWVSNAFKNNKFDHVWPIVVLRVFSLVFYQVLDVASLTLFLMTMDCQYFSVDADVKGYNQEFPDVYCWSMPHVAHVAVAAVSIATFFVLATVFTMAEIELNPVSKNLMGIAHTRAEVVGFGIKMFMTCVSVFVNGLRWMSTFQLIASFFLCYLYLRWLPHLTALVNHIRVGSYFSVFWAALWFIILAFEPGITVNDAEAEKKQAEVFTIIMFVGFVPAGLFGAWLSWKRTNSFVVDVAQKYREAPLTTKPHRIHRFADAREVEIASRCCRVWLDPDNLDPQAVALAERIIRAGMSLLPGQPYMAIWWSSFLIDVQGSYQSGYTELQNAKKMHNPSFLERFCIFIREQEHTQKASAASSGDNGNVDLVSYVEFQRNHRLAMRLHMDALIAKRTFWEMLLHNQVTFDKLASAVDRIETTVRASERMYKQVLQRHSNSVKILQLYVKFLQSVRNDPWSAARWAAEAEKLQRLEEEANERAVFGDGGHTGMQNHDDSKGVIIMGANCLVRMINERAAAIFGYTVKSELVGKNINLIVPPPFSRNHNNYVRNYIQTGQAKILDQVREFVAMHKDRYVVPLEVFVTKVSGIGEDSVFMGIFQPIPPQPNTATLWVLNGGMVLSCDGEFTDWLGYKHEDIHGKNVSELVQDRQGFDELMGKIRTEAVAAATRRLDSGLPSANARTVHNGRVWTLPRVRFRHLYIDEVVEVDMAVRMGGIGETAIYSCKMTRQQVTVHSLLVSDAKGRINHVTTRLAEQLGSTVGRLQAGNMLHALDALLPAPFMRVHHAWYRDKSEQVPVWSCRSGLIQGITCQGPEGPRVTPFALNFRRKEVPNKEPLNVVQFEPRTAEQLLDERRLWVTLNSQGVITGASASPTALFGLDPQALLGTHLMHVVDVLNPHGAPGQPGGTTKRTSSGAQSDEDMATKMLMHMAERSYDTPGMSWRVGVSAITDQAALRALGTMGMAMIAKRTVPAVMVVDAFMAPPQLEGAKVVLPSEMQIKVELWRADYLSGVVELDTQGHVVSQGIKDHAVYNPHLLTGVPSSMISGVHFGALVPLHGKSLLEALFMEGGLSAPKPGAGGRGPGGRGGIRGGMRNAGQFCRRRGVGPLQTIKLPHGTDGGELELTVQAVVKQDIGVGSSLYVLLHVVSPRCGRPDLRTWIWNAPPPVLAGQANMSRRVSRRTSNLGAGTIPKDVLAQYAEAMGDAAAPHKTPARARFAGDDEAAATKRKPHKEPAPPPHAVFDDVPSTPPDADGTDGLQVLSRNSTGLPVVDSPATGAPPGTTELPGTVHGDASLYGVPAEGAEGGTEALPKKPTFDLDKVDHEVTYDSPLLPHPPGSANGSPRKGERTSRQIRAAGASIKRKGSGLPGTKKQGTFVKGKKKGKGSVKVEGGGSNSSGAESDTGGLKEGGRDRIARWVTASEAASPTGSPHDSEGEEDEEAQEEVVEEEVDEEQYGEELDEAGTTMNDYKRGKRLKKLVKMLLGPQAQKPNVRLKWVSVGCVLTLIVVDLAMFMTFMQLVNTQVSQVNDLRSASRAVNRVMQASISTSALEILLAGKGDSQLRHLGEEGVQQSIDYTTPRMETRVHDMSVYHQGIYRGFGKTRQLPVAYNLRSIWDEPKLPIRMYFQNEYKTFSQVQNMSLWDAGNQFIKVASNILQTFEAQYGLASNNSHAFENSTDVLWILYNGPRDVMTAYQATLDGMMQQAIDDSNKVNNVQLIILAIEGGFIGITTIIVMWIVSAKLVFRRFSIYSVFMLVPHGVVKTLATKSVDLEQGDEDEAHDQDGDEQDALDAPAGATSMGPGATSGSDMEGGFSGRKGAQPGQGTKITLANQKGDAPAEKKGLWATLTSCFRPPDANSASKRSLRPSWAAMFWITWPFIFWAVFVIAINTWGYASLKNISAPIAISNIVQFVSIRVNRVLMFSQRLVSEQYLDPGTGYCSSPDSGGPASPTLKALYRHTLQVDYTALRKEVDAMLYGNTAESVANSTDPHFRLATTGIMFTQGADLMYSRTDCWCQEPSDCQPPDSEYYRYTRNGLDQMLKQFFYSIESLLQAPDDQVNLKSEYFRYIYEIGNSDITGGLVALTDVYTVFVTSMYQQALTLHIVAFSMCCALGVLFLLMIMRPNYQRCTHESKRVAELLSNIPPEIDVETMIAEALRTKHGIEAGGPPAPGGAHGHGTGGDSKGGRGSNSGLGKPGKEELLMMGGALGSGGEVYSAGRRRSMEGVPGTVRRSFEMGAANERGSARIGAFYPA